MGTQSRARVSAKPRMLRQVFMTRLYVWIKQRGRGGGGNFFFFYKRARCERHVMITPPSSSRFVCMKGRRRKRDLRRANFSTDPASLLPVLRSLLIPQFSRLLTLRPVLFDAVPCKLNRGAERTDDVEANVLLIYGLLGIFPRTLTPTSPV